MRLNKDIDKLWEDRVKVRNFPKTYDSDFENYRSKLHRVLAENLPSEYTGVDFHHDGHDLQFYVRFESGLIELYPGVGGTFKFSFVLDPYQPLSPQIEDMARKVRAVQKGYRITLHLDRDPDVEYMMAWMDQHHKLIGEVGGDITDKNATRDLPEGWREVDQRNGILEREDGTQVLAFTGNYQRVRWCVKDIDGKIWRKKSGRRMSYGSALQAINAVESHRGGAE